MSMELISVVLCTYNRGEMLRAALHDMTCQQIAGTFSLEIIVVDDGSTDHTRNVVARAASMSSVAVRYVRGEGSGPTGALNAGLAESRGQWIAFFDDDQLAGPEWLGELLAAANENDAQLVGGPIEPLFVQSDAANLGPVCRALCGEWPNFKGARKRNHIPLPAGGNRLVKRMVFDSIGGFDGAIVIGGADADLVLRARAAGFRFAWAPNAVVKHVISPDRTSPVRIRRYALVAGCSVAYIDRKNRGLLAMLLLCAARIGRAFLVKLPLLLSAYMRGGPFKVLDVKATLWTATGYTRGALHQLAPRLFPQRGFFVRSRFRIIHENASRQVYRS